MATVESTCEECEGKRFQASVLEYTLGGRNIAEVLAMSVTEAEEFFGDGEARTPAAHKILDRLADVGLGYLTLGQPLTTLSGGERQRLKLATQMAEKGDVYVLDEPTTGLHLADVEQLLGLLDRLVDSGKSVIVIEHHQAVMAHADWIIDLGPGAGHDGGRIVFEGTPADLVAARSTLTGEHLAAYVGDLTGADAALPCARERAADHPLGPADRRGRRRGLRRTVRRPRRERRRRARRGVLLRLPAARPRRGSWTPAAAPAGWPPGWRSWATTARASTSTPRCWRWPAASTRSCPGCWPTWPTLAPDDPALGGRFDVVLAAGNVVPAAGRGRAPPTVRALAGLLTPTGRSSPGSGWTAAPATRLPGDPPVVVRRGLRGGRAAPRQPAGDLGGRAGARRRLRGERSRALQALCKRRDLDSLGPPPLATVDRRRRGPGRSDVMTAEPAVDEGSGGSEASSIEAHAVIPRPVADVWRVLAGPAARRRCSAPEPRSGARASRGAARTAPTACCAATTRWSRCASPGTPTSTRRPRWCSSTSPPTARAPGCRCGTTTSTTAPTTRRCDGAGPTPSSGWRRDRLSRDRPSREPARAARTAVRRAGGAGSVPVALVPAAVLLVPALGVLPGVGRGRSRPPPSWRRGPSPRRPDCGSRRPRPGAW